MVSSPIIMVTQHMSTSFARRKQPFCKVLHPFRREPDPLLNGNESCARSLIPPGTTHPCPSGGSFPGKTRTLSTNSVSDSADLLTQFQNTSKFEEMHAIKVIFPVYDCPHLIHHNTMFEHRATEILVYIFSKDTTICN